MWANNVRFAHGVLLAKGVKVATQCLGVGEVGRVGLHDGCIFVLEPQARASGLIGYLIRPTIAVADDVELVVVGCELHAHGFSLQAQARVGVDQVGGVADGGEDVRHGLGELGQGDQLVDVEVDLGLRHVVQGLQLGLGHRSLFQKIPNIVRWVGGLLTFIVSSIISHCTT